MTDPAPDEVFCPSCGAVIHETTNFCPECGGENDAFEAGGPPPGEGSPGTAPPGGAPERTPPGSGPGRAPPGGAPEPTPPPEGAPPGGPLPPGDGARYDRLIDRDWDVASQQQAVAGLKSGIYAAWIGLVATLYVAALTLLSMLGDALSGNLQVGEVPVTAPSGGLSAEAGADLILTVVEAAQDPWLTVVKFFGWIFYSANFVPITIDYGTRSFDVDLLAGLSSLGASPMVFRITVVFVLFVFGYRAAASIGYDSFPEAAGAGASVAIGYLLVLVPGALLVEVSGGGGGISPNLLLTVAFAGGMAAVFGGAGGLVREYVRRSG